MHIINTTPQAQTDQPLQTRHNSGNPRMAGSVPHYHNGASQQKGQQAHPASFTNQLRPGPEGAQPVKDGNDSFGLDSIVDAVNPLQHLPVIGSIYREVTGDDLGPVARVAGGALYGGAVGGAVATANAALEHSSGDDIAGHAIAMLDSTGTDAHTRAHTRSHTQKNTPEARVANAIAAYGQPQADLQDEEQTYNSVRSEHEQPAHIRQSSYNG